jgi:hypothetical protein
MADEHKDEKKTVKIGCSMPNGVVLDLDGFQRIDGEDRRIIGEGRVTLRGMNAPGVAGNYAYTDIDAGFWQKWIERNKGSSLIRDGVIFAMPEEPRAEPAEKEPEAAAEKEAAETKAGASASSAAAKA